MKSVLFAATAVCLAAPAYAGLIADYSVNGGGSFALICSGGPSCSPGANFATSNGLLFTVYGATSNSPGTATGSDVLQATVQMTNPTAAAQSVILRVGDTGYTAPSGNVSFANNISGTVVTGGAGNLFSSTACVNPTDAQSSCAGGTTTPLIAADITLPGSGAQSNSVPVPGLATPYSMTEFLNITLDPGANINFSASADVVPAREASGLALMGVGLVGLGWIVSRRRNVSSLPA